MDIPIFISTSRLVKRPPSKQTIFCDGSADNTFREGTDIELSHWVPNRTPRPYKADTSTEICLNFIQNPQGAEWDLVVNNHADVDGVLAVFCLVQSDLALKHPATIIQAAEMGDFWGWGEELAQALFQELTLLMNRLELENTDPQAIYERSIERTATLLTDGPEDNALLRAGLACLQESVSRIESGHIQRHVYNDHFTHYAIPCALAAEDLQRALHVPTFNAPLSAASLLWPHARSRWDRERVQLVSSETKTGWHYDLWYPGYMWAETPNSWRPPGLTFAGSSNGYYFTHPRLQQIAQELQEIEPSGGAWTLANKFTPFEPTPGRDYPIVLWVQSATGSPEMSRLPPELVAPRLATVFV